MVDATKHKHEPLITDGPVDTVVRQTMIPAAVPSPPLSPITTVQNATPLSGVEDLSLKEWQPYYLTTLEALPADVSARIPAQRNMATFTFDMLQNLFGGVGWSPGLRYINTTGACLLQNRTYYMLDPTNEPYLPKAPGKHGAKLSAFFNKAPEEEFDNLLRAPTRTLTSPYSSKSRQVVTPITATTRRHGGLISSTMIP